MKDWRPVKGFEDYYSVSRYGDVLSHRSGKLRKPVLNTRNGYMYIVLYGKDKKSTATVHRIVAHAFVPNPNNYDCINHKDENKLNNSADNLEWCTKEYNNTYNGKTQRCCKPVIAINPLTGEEIEYSSARQAEKYYHTNYKNISAACRGKRPRAGGMEWRFK